MKLKIKNKNNNEWFEIDEGAVISICKDETLDSGTAIISNLDHEIDLEPYDICEIIESNRGFSFTMCVDSFVKTQICLQPKIYKYEIKLFSLTKMLESVILPSLKITKIKGRTRSIWNYLNLFIYQYCPFIKVGNLSDYYYTNRWILDSTWSSKFSDECPEMQWNQPTLREVLNDLAMIKDCIVIINSENKISFMDLTEVTNPNETAMNGINYIQESKSSEDYVSDLYSNLVNVTNDKTDDVNNIVTKSEWFSINSNEALLTSDNCIFKTQYPIYKIKKLEMLFPVWINYTEVRDGQVSTAYEHKARCIWIKQDLMNARLLHHKGLVASANIINVNGTYGHQLIFESQEWQIKKMLSATDSESDIYEDEMNDYKDFTLYFSRGGTEVRGFNNSSKYLIFNRLNTLSYLKLILTYGMQYELPTVEYNDKTYVFTAYPEGWTIYEENTLSTNTNYYATYFNIEYETTTGSTFKAGKDIIKNSEGDYSQSFHREVVDNQTNSYIDSYTQGFLEYQKANRLGNIQKLINARYMANETSANMLKIGDMIDESVIYKCEYQFYKQHIEVNALATKDYVLRNYFTGVKAKIRSWNVVSGSEALTRADVDKWYLELSFNQKEDKGLSTYTTGIMDYNVTEYFISSMLSSENIRPLKYCFMYTDDGATGKYPANESGGKVTYYQLDFISRIIGNSLVFTFALQDNYWAGKYIDYSLLTVILPHVSGTAVHNWYNLTYSTNITGGIPTNYHRYTDNNGEFNYLSYVFTYDYRNKNLVSQGQAIVDFDASNPTAQQEADNEEFIKQLCLMPKTYESNFRVENSYDYVKFQNRKLLYKDSQEIINFSTQFEFCKDTNNLCFTKEFISRQEAIRTVANNHTFKLIVANSNTYNFRNIQLPALNNQLNSYSLSVSSNTTNQLSAKLMFTIGGEHKNDLLNKALYITDENDVLLMAFNSVPSDSIIERGGSNHRATQISIYLNLLKTRDYNIYDSQLNQNVVDKL